MTPTDIDDLDDEMFAAMVRLMQREAAAVQANQPNLPTRG
jgi:hypothetical protein